VTVDAQAVADKIEALWCLEEAFTAKLKREDEVAKRRRRLERRLHASASTAGSDMVEALRAVLVEDWLPLLTDLEVPRSGSRKVRCPFHGSGVERTPSLHCYETTWACFGCHRGGDILSFAAFLWNLDPHSSDFTELRQRLAGIVFGPAPDSPAHQAAREEVA
jgi:hypothetical protein